MERVRTMRTPFWRKTTTTIASSSPSTASPATITSTTAASPSPPSPSVVTVFSREWDWQANGGSRFLESASAIVTRRSSRRCLVLRLRRRSHGRAPMATSRASAQTSSGGSRSSAPPSRASPGLARPALKEWASASSSDGRLTSAAGRFGAFFLIKNLDTGKEFVVNEYGGWNRLSNLQTGRQLTMEEFEKCVGFSPVVKELMRRGSIHRGVGGGVGGTTTTAGGEMRKGGGLAVNSLRTSKRRGVAHSVSGLIHDHRVFGEEIVFE